MQIKFAFLYFLGVEESAIEMLFINVELVCSLLDYSGYRGYRGCRGCFLAGGDACAPGQAGRRGRLRTPDRTLHLQTVCSKLTAGETPASPDVFRG